MSSTTRLAASFTWLRKPPNPFFPGAGAAAEGARDSARQPACQSAPPVISGISNTNATLITLHNALGSIETPGFHQYCFRGLSSEAGWCKVLFAAAFASAGIKGSIE